MRGISIFIVLCTLATPVAWAKPAASKQNPCTAKEEAIQKQMDDLGFCWEDKECITRRFGYPWQVSACDGSIVSTIDDSKKINALETAIRTYDKDCVQTDPVRKKESAAFAESVKHNDCTDYKPTLLCISGKCVNQVRALFQKDDKMLPTEKSIDPAILEQFEKSRERNNAR